MDQRKRLALLIAALASVVIVAIAVIAGLNVSQKNRYNRAIESADHYLEQKDYENAVLQYQEAIRIDAHRERAWVSLANTYIQAGEKEYARSTLEKGVEIARGGKQIRTMLGGFNSIVAEMEAKQKRVENKENKEPVPELNAETIIRLISRSYHDHEQTGGIASNTQNADGSRTVRVNGIAAELHYSASGIDEETDAIKEEALPDVIRIDDIMSVFGGLDQLSYADVEKFPLTDLTIEKDTEFQNALSFGLDGFEGSRIYVECDPEGNVTKGARNRIELTAQITEEQQEKEKSIYGVVRDAQDNKAVAEAELLFRAGTSETGDPLYTCKTDESGAYEVMAAPGEYTVQIVAEGYIEEYRSIYVDAYGTSMEQDFLITSVLGGGEARIVLSWGSTPFDLDSYLIGKSDSGTDVNVNFTQKRVDNAQGEAIADLDIDVMSGYGPETITLHDMNGVYEFSVIDYNHTEYFPESGATVTVYLPGEVPSVIPIDPSGYDHGDRFVWSVFTLDHGKLEVHSEWVSKDVSSVHKWG